MLIQQQNSNRLLMGMDASERIPYLLKRYHLPQPLLGTINRESFELRITVSLDNYYKHSLSLTHPASILKKP